MELELPVKRENVKSSKTSKSIDQETNSSKEIFVDDALTNNSIVDSTLQAADSRGKDVTAVIDSSSDLARVAQLHVEEEKVQKNNNAQKQHENIWKRKRTSLHEVDLSSGLTGNTAHINDDSPLTTGGANFFYADVEKNLYEKEKVGLMSGLDSFQAIHTKEGGQGELKIRRQLPLFTIEDVEEYQKYNKHLKTGYRKNLSISDCLKSVFCIPFFDFILHNESVNIWTHLFAFAYFFLLLLGRLFSVNYTKLTTMDTFFLDGLLVTYMISTFNSALFHTVTSHSEYVSELGLLADVSGIAISILLSSVSAIYFSFYCDNHRWALFYTISDVLFFVLIVIAFYLLANSTRLPPFLMIYAQGIRTTLMVTWSFFNLIPIAHWIILSGGFEAPEVKAMFQRIIVITVMGTVSIIFYLTQMPERFSKSGYFDKFGHSHNIWHVFTFLTMCYWYDTTEVYASYRLSHSCSAGNGFQPNDPNAFQKLKLFPTHPNGPPLTH